MWNPNEENKLIIEDKKPFLHTEYFTEKNHHIFTHKNELHSHHYYSIVFIIEGAGTFLIENHEYEVKPHTFFIVCPGQLLLNIELKETKGFALLFSEEYLQHFDDAFINALHYDVLHRFNMLALPSSKECATFMRYF